VTYILHIETATDICSVAISEKDQLLAHCESSEPNQHSKELTLLIAAVLEKANLKMSDLAAVALSGGPGSYTSLRVGSAVAKGICYAMNIPLIAVDTLQAIAAGSMKEHNLPDAIYCPMIDARRMEVYTALYDPQNEEVRPVEARILDEDFKRELLTLNKKIIFSGNGTTKCRDFFSEECFLFNDTICNSLNMLYLAYQKFTHSEFKDIVYFSPNYFKAPNISESKKVL
jgi:tRNA threonylcarbamoyladenosine biosynthesis protein TsaB